jgi:hypothetical protein
MHPDAPYFSILLCLTPDDFTCQVRNAATQWVKVKIFKMVVYKFLKYFNIYAISYFIILSFDITYKLICVIIKSSLDTFNVIRDLQRYRLSHH